MTLWQDARVLISGGAGFIGRHLTASILEHGGTVVILDDFSTGSRTALEGYTDDARVTVIDADVVKPLPDLPRCDVVYNLASPASPPIYQKDPIRTWRVNIYGTEHMALAALEWDAVFVQASTSEIYGDPVVHPQPESYWGNVNTVGIRSCYDEGKRAAETLVMDLVRCHGLNGRMARIFNTYGPGMNVADGRLLPNFISQALAGEPLTVYGDGSQTRSLCYVADLVAGLMALAEVDAARGEAINLGNTRERTVLEIAQIVAETLAPGSEVVHHPLPADDPIRRCPDVSKAKRILGWSADTRLDEGLAQMVDDFRRGRGT